MLRASRERIHIPFGVGICGHVAQTKETINLRNAYEVRKHSFTATKVTNVSLDDIVCLLRVNKLRMYLHTLCVCLREVNAVSNGETTYLEKAIVLERRLTDSFRL